MLGCQPLLYFVFVYCVLVMSCIERLSKLNSLLENLFIICTGLYLHSLSVRFHNELLLVKYWSSDWLVIHTLCFDWLDKPLTIESEKWRQANRQADIKITNPPRLVNQYQGQKINMHIFHVSSILSLIWRYKTLITRNYAAQ